MPLRALIAAGLMLGGVTLPSAPALAQATNKTVTVSFGVTVTARDQAGRQRTATRNVAKTMYVSSAGRVFVRNQRRAGKFGQDNERGPETTASHFTLRGNTLTGTLVFISGASRLVVTFAPDFQSCTAQVAMARESGKALTWKGLNGKILTATGPVVVSSPSCSVQTGNAFAS
jgi:hypothetical protein